MRLPDATVAAELHTENYGGGGRLTEDFPPHPSPAIAAPRDFSRSDFDERATAGSGLSRSFIAIHRETIDTLMTLT